MSDTNNFEATKNKIVDVLRVVISLIRVFPSLNGGYPELEVTLKNVSKLDDKYRAECLKELGKCKGCLDKDFETSKETLEDQINAFAFDGNTKTNFQCTTDDNKVEMLRLFLKTNFRPTQDSAAFHYSDLYRFVDFNSKYSPADLEMFAENVTDSNVGYDPDTIKLAIYNHQRKTVADCLGKEVGIIWEAAGMIADLTEDAKKDAKVVHSDVLNLLKKLTTILNDRRTQSSYGRETIVDTAALLTVYKYDFTARNMSIGSGPAQQKYWCENMLEHLSSAAADLKVHYDLQKTLSFKPVPGLMEAPLLAELLSSDDSAVPQSMIDLYKKLCTLVSFEQSEVLATKLDFTGDLFKLERIIGREHTKTSHLSKICMSQMIMDRIPAMLESESDHIHLQNYVMMQGKRLEFVRCAMNKLSYCESLCNAFNKFAASKYPGMDKMAYIYKFLLTRYLNDRMTDLIKAIEAYKIENHDLDNLKKALEFAITSTPADKRADMREALIDTIEMDISVKKVFLETLSVARSIREFLCTSYIKYMGTHALGIFEDVKFFQDTALIADAKIFNNMLNRISGYSLDWILHKFGMISDVYPAYNAKGEWIYCMHKPLDNYIAYFANYGIKINDGVFSATISPKLPKDRKDIADMFINEVFLGHGTSKDDKASDMFYGNGDYKPKVRIHVSTSGGPGQTPSAAQVPGSTPTDPTWMGLTKNQWLIIMAALAAVMCVVGGYFIIRQKNE